MANVKLIKKIVGLPDKNKSNYVQSVSPFENLIGPQDPSGTRPDGSSQILMGPVSRPRPVNNDTSLIDIDSISAIIIISVNAFSKTSLYLFIFGKENKWS